MPLLVVHLLVVHLLVVPLLAVFLRVVPLPVLLEGTVFPNHFPLMNGHDLFAELSS